MLVAVPGTPPTPTLAFRAPAEVVAPQRRCIVNQRGVLQLHRKATLAELTGRICTLTTSIPFNSDRLFQAREVRTLSTKTSNLTGLYWMA